MFADILTAVALTVLMLLAAIICQYTGGNNI